MTIRNNNTRVIVNDVRVLLFFCIDRAVARGGRLYR